MPELIIYQTPQDYYNATIDYLNTNQVRNNLIIGLLNTIQNKAEVIPTAVYLNVFESNTIIFSAAYNGPKILITGYASSFDAVQLAANYFKNKNLQPFGVFGPALMAEQFAIQFGITQLTHRSLYLYELSALIPFTVDQTPFFPATADDLEWITDWSYQFLIDAHMSPLPKPEPLEQLTKNRIEEGIFYKWIINNNPVAISAEIRKTKNVAIVGYVYTPQNLRGNGYAFSIVYALSELMFAKGFEKCVLFADDKNPVSNYIYKKMGYQYVETFKDFNLF